MPIYEYKCDKCGTQFEELVSVFSDSKPKCPKCGKNNTKRKVSAFSSVARGLRSFASGGSCGPGGG